MSACPNPICGHDAASHGRDGCYICACKVMRLDGLSRASHAVRVRREGSLAHARNTDPITSHLAAASVDLSNGQRLVLEEFERRLTLFPEPKAMTDEELTRRMPRLSPSGARSRRAELTSMGLLVDTGGRVQGASGRWMIQWGLASWLWINGVPQFPIVNKGEQMALPLDEK